MKKLTREWDTKEPAEHLAYEIFHRLGPGMVLVGMNGQSGADVIQSMMPYFIRNKIPATWTEYNPSDSQDNVDLLRRKKVVLISDILDVPAYKSLSKQIIAKHNPASVDLGVLVLEANKAMVDDIPVPFNGMYINSNAALEIKDRGKTIVATYS